jgi:hypothetical protein
MPASNIPAQLTYQVCPIILTGGIASQIPGALLPLLSLFTGVGVNNLGLPFDIGDLDDAFGAFNVMPGGTLQSQQIAKYPFANQSVAANATIREPLTLSVIMDAPMRGPNAWLMKQLIMTNLKMTLDRHNNAGGTYTVITPAYMYDYMIMTALTDNSRGSTSLPQNAWRFDFERPLVALQDLAAAQNQLMSKITGGQPITPVQSGLQVGALDAQTSLALSQNQTVNLGGNLTSGSGSIANSAIAGSLNFPTIPASTGFPSNVSS